MKKIVRLTESDLTRIVNRVIKENEDNSENIKESFDPMVGIDNFLNNPIMVTLATAWLLSGKFKVGNLKSNLEDMKNDFLDYCNSMGYSIDKEILDLKFKQLINRVKGILKSSTGNEEMNEEDDHEEKEVRTRKMVRDMEGKTKSNRKEYTGKGRQAPPPPSFKR